MNYRNQLSRTEQMERDETECASYEHVYSDVLLGANTN
jgi:hypothetical protein